jgi:hypothetical protein
VHELLKDLNVKNDEKLTKKNKKKCIIAKEKGK